MARADGLNLTDGNDQTFIQLETNPTGVKVTSRPATVYYTPRTIRSIARHLNRLADRQEKQELRASRAVPKKRR